LLDIFRFVDPAVPLRDLRLLLLRRVREQRGHISVAALADVAMQLVLEKTNPASRNASSQARMWSSLLSTKVPSISNNMALFIAPERTQQRLGSNDPY
jgi:hypothetical protein